MAILYYDRIWSGPMGEIATQAAVVRRVETMLVAGERDEALILEQVLQTVCGGRLTSALRARLTPDMAGLEGSIRPPDYEARFPA